jgi:hypothetical protein
LDIMESSQYVTSLIAQFLDSPPHRVFHILGAAKRQDVLRIESEPLTACS